MITGKTIALTRWTFVGKVIPLLFNMLSRLVIIHTVIVFLSLSCVPKLPCSSLSPRVCLNSCSLSQWCHSTISFSVIPFSCLQSFPASESFLRSQFFASGGQSIRVSASASVLPMNIQDWVPLEWTGWISLQSKGLSRVFSNTTVQVHWYKWLLKIPHYYCITVDFLFYGC